MLRVLRAAGLACRLSLGLVVAGCGGGDDHHRPSTVVKLAQDDGRFTTLLAAAQAAGLDDELSADGPLTLFALTDAPFADLFDELGLTREQLFDNVQLPTDVLTDHVVQGLVLKVEVPVDTPITPVEGGTFSISAAGEITDARDRRATLVSTDTLASNGVIHVIDKVLLPAAAE